MSIKAIRELETLASVCPELNMANYTEDDVRQLNDWAIEMSLLVEKVIATALAQKPATGEPVLFIHPDTFAMDNAHVGAWKPGHELTGYIPLYTHPAPGVPRGAVNLGAHSLASELAQAVAQDDDDPEGHDMSAGLFGPTVSAWLRKVAADFLSHPAPGVPDGYALVPIEPTDEMMAEMLGPFIAPFIAINDDNRSAFIEAYPRMLTAAQAQKGQP